MSRARRAERLRESAERIASRPVLVEGDAVELLAALRSTGGESEIVVTDRERLLSRDGERARVVVLAVDGDGRRSAFTKASGMLRELDYLLDDDAIRIVVIQSGRSRALPSRLQPLLASEILFQVVSAIPGASAGRRTMRQAFALIGLDAVGLRVLRFG